MGKKNFWISIIGVVISFAGGFLLANAFNRQEIASLQAEVGRLKTDSPQRDETSSETVLTNDEIRQKIDEADRNPDNAEFQKNLGMALYRYATMRQNADLLPDVGRLLERAYTKNPDDYETIIALGNVYTDLYQTKNDAKNLEKSRQFYRKALEIKPNDAEAHNDLGASFLFANPPENERAIAEFQKSLQTNPKDERTLEYLIRATANAGRIDEAENLIAKLKQINPKNEALSDLETLVAQGKNKR